jgi:hypothetical protein
VRLYLGAKILTKLFFSCFGLLGTLAMAGCMETAAQMEQARLVSTTSTANANATESLAATFAKDAAHGSLV